MISNELGLVVANSLHLLWLDSDDSTVDEGKPALVEQGWLVDQACSLVEALDRISQTAYDVVILDLQLPDTLGTDAWTYIRKLKPDIIGIMTTSSLSLFKLIRVDANGLVAFLHKPLSMPSVMNIITRRLEDTGSTQSNAGEINKPQTVE